MKHDLARVTAQFQLHGDFVRAEPYGRGHIGEVKAGWCRHFVGWGGDFYFKDWHADRTKSTGLLLQKGAHDIDVLHWLCGGVHPTRFRHGRPDGQNSPYVARNIR